MDLKASPLVLVAIFFLFSTTKALNIARVLENYPNFSTIKDLFTKTDLTGLINKRQTITVLVFDNSAMGSIAGRPIEEIKNVLMTYVVLDYLDEIKLRGFTEKSILLTTLYQTTGLGEDMNGFLNISKMGDGKVVFGSAVKDSPLDSVYVDTVFRNPYNLSVVQLSMPFVAPGLGSPVPVPPQPSVTPLPAPAPSKAAPAPSNTQPAPAPERVETPKRAPASAPSHHNAPAPGPSDETDPETPADDGNQLAADGSAASTAGLSFCAALVLGMVASFVGFEYEKK